MDAQHCEIKSHASPTNAAAPKRVVLLDKCCVQRERRSSPRLKDIPQSKRLYYGTSLKVSPHHHHDDSVTHSATTSLDNTSSAGYEAPVRRGILDKCCGQGERRCSPRLMDIPQTKQLYYGTSLKVLPQQHHDDSVIYSGTTSLDNTSSTGDEAPPKRGVLLDKCCDQQGRRCSPRLKDIPESKRPYYGTSFKVLPQQHHDDSVNHSGTIGLDDTSSAGDEAPVKGGVLLDKCCAQQERRCSPRLKDIPQSKRPYYGSSLKVLPQLHHDDSLIHSGNTSLDDTSSVANEAPVKRGVLLDKCCDQRERRYSPRLKGISQSKLPYYGTSLNVLPQKHQDDSVIHSGPTSLDDTSSAGDEAPMKRGVFLDKCSGQGERRCSPCLKDIPQGKQPYYGTSLKVLPQKHHDDAVIHSGTTTLDVTSSASDEAGDHHCTAVESCFNRKHALVASPNLLGELVMDISGGQEKIRIPVVNLVDDTPFPATGFTYSRSVQVAENVDLPPNADGCRCKGNCMHPKSCTCARLNDSKFPYVRHNGNGGRLRKAKDVVFECGPSCGCGPDCLNRISQQGIKYQLEVFRTLDKGWAVRTKDFIPSGAHVCEYVGILRQTDELDNVDVNDYIFEIDCLHTINGIEGRERRFGAVSVSLCENIEKMEDGFLERTPEFCIDANIVGNVARFINHSCEPNLFVQCILSNHHDARLARIVLFAAKSISPWQELTYDYGYPVDSVIGKDGKVKVQPCYCGTEDCRKRLY